MCLLSAVCGARWGSVLPPGIAGCSTKSGGARPLGYTIPCQPRDGIPTPLAVPGEWGRAFPLPKVQGCWAGFSSYYPHLQRLPLLSPSATASSNGVRCCCQLANTSCPSGPPARDVAEGRWLLAPSHPRSQTSSGFSPQQPGMGPAHAKGQFQQPRREKVAPTRAKKRT